MSEGRSLPPALERAIAQDPPRARRLASPWQRLLWLGPLALFLVWWVPAHFGLRHDAVRLGPWLARGGSSLQLLGGLALLAAALVEAIPGRQLPRRRLLALTLGALALFVGLTLATDLATGTAVPAGREARYVEVCLGRPPLFAAPLVALALLLAFRAFPVRPALAGALAGFGSGLVVDAGWRLFCEVSDPRHVLLVHGGAILITGLVGAILATLLARLSHRR